MTTHELTWPTARKSPGSPIVSVGRIAGETIPEFLRYQVDIQRIDQADDDADIEHRNG